MVDYRSLLGPSGPAETPYIKKDMLRMQLVNILYSWVTVDLLEWRNGISASLGDSIRIQCRSGGIGRHARLKILCPYGRAGSSPACGTIVSCYDDLSLSEDTIVHGK